MSSRPAAALALAICILALAGCGGGGETSNPTPPPTSNPPPPPPNTPPVIGASGGTVTESSGAEVIFPAGAVDSDTTFRIAIDSTGAPPLPAGIAGAGSTYAITPHGGNFTQPVEVRIPAPNVTLLPNQQLKLAKAQPNGQWEILSDATVVGGNLKTSVNSFSFFMGVIVTYQLSIAQAVPFEFVTTLSCGEQDCNNLVGPASLTYTVAGNGGQLPQGCDNPRMQTMVINTSVVPEPEIPLGSDTVTRTIAAPPNWPIYSFHTYMHCPGFASNITDSRARWSLGPSYPNLSVVRVPAQLDVVEGLHANLDALLGGGAVRSAGPSITLVTPPTATDRATIDWQRSDDVGASWRLIARSFQDEANPRPFGTGLLWRPWQVRHGFVATAMDQGALIRVRACYTPPAPHAAPPCVTGPATRINVLQQSALPAIVDQPRSVLIRTAETATFSATASGLPAPTLQWQTRPANSTGEWTNVAVGSGGMANSYTTAPRLLSNNGEQYRVVATNALGSTASVAVTVSVSDLDVAPSITTQPASMSVTTGGDAVFAVVAYGTEALSYQWRFNGTDIAGANSPVLRLPGVTGASIGSYSVNVSNNAGGVVSNEAVLNVTANTPEVIAPTIVTQPAAVVVNAGNTATFAVGVNGTGPFNFQWRREGTNILGANSAVFTLNDVALPNAGQYSVVVSNSAGAIVSGNALLSVVEANGALPPTITSQPSTLVVPAGGSGFMAVGATGSGPLSYQWSFNGTPIPGATLPVLSLTNVSSANVGNYTVTVANSVTSTASQTAQLILLGAPVITQQPLAATVVETESATFSVAADGSGLRYQWLANGNPISGATEASYTTPMLVAANTGAAYSVMVYNAAGMVFSGSAVLTVLPLTAPTVAQQPADVTIDSGQSASLCAAFGGTPPFTVRLQRWVASAWVNVAAERTVNDNAASCDSTGTLQAADTGAQFRFIAANGAGQTTTITATVTVTAAPPVSATTLVSVALNGSSPADNSSDNPSISADGRLVAFTSQGLDLVAGVSNPSTEQGNAYVRNLATGVTTLINQTPAGTQSSRGVVDLKLAGGGRYAVFSSLADDLVAGDTNGSQDVFLRDLQTGTTERLNVLPNGSQLTGVGNGQSPMHVDLSADGRWVLFMSFYDLDGDGSPLPSYTLFLRDTVTDTTWQVATGGAYAIQQSAISPSGELIFYVLPTATNTVIFEYDVETRLTRALFTLNGSPSTEYIDSDLSVSDNGQYISFSMRSPALGLTSSQVVVVDRTAAPDAFTIASTGANGVGNGHSGWPKLSGDGRYVVFSSLALNLTLGSQPLYPYLVVRDLVASTTTVASRRPNGTAVTAGTQVNGQHALSADASVLAFVADVGEMTGGAGGSQVYAAPRP